MKIETTELINITGGGLSISGSLISAISSAINAIMDVGRSLGTAIKMMVTKKSC